jgi:hypothetical protein
MLQRRLSTAAGQPNGVLLVTTKRGKDAPLQVNFSTQQGFSQATGLPKFLDSYDYATLYKEALANNGLAPRYNDADLQAYKSGTDPYFHPNVNWYDEVLRKTAPVSNYNLSFRGGNSTARIFRVVKQYLQARVYIKSLAMRMTRAVTRLTTGSTLELTWTLICQNDSLPHYC